MKTLSGCQLARPLTAMDFKTVEMFNPITNTLSTYYLLFAMHLATREVHFCGMTEHPNEEWMLQQARNLTDPFNGFLTNKTHIIMDNDTIFSDSFRHALERDGPKAVRTCYHVPNMNSYMARS